MSTRDELAGQLAASLNKTFKDTKVAYFLDGSDTTPTDIKDTTFFNLLDLAIANKPNGGIAVGRITEITGLEASGKVSSCCTSISKYTERKVDVAVYIDTENAINEEFLQALGIDTTKLLYIQLETVEDIFEVMENIILTVREGEKNRLVTIAVDSVAAATTKVEQSADYSKDGWATSKAIVLSKAMRKITNMIGRQRIALVFTNQLRQKMGVMFGDPWTTSGGKAIAFHASCRLRLKPAGQIKATVNGQAQTVGIKTKCVVVKNRMGPPLRTAEFDIYFDSGIDDLGSYLTIMKAYKLIKQGGSWYTYTKADGTDWKCTSKTWKSTLLEDEELRKEIYNLICDTLIMDYKSEDLGIDDVVYKDILSEVSEEHKTNHLRERNSRVMIIDGLNTFIRSWTTNPTMNEDGDHTGGVIGSLKSIGYQIREFNPTRCIVTFDGKNGSQSRKKIHEGYKAGREKNRFRVNRQYQGMMDEEQERLSMKQQFVWLNDMLDSLPVQTMIYDGIEADDTIAYLTKHTQYDLDGEVVIVSTDKDFLQLVDDDTIVWSPTKKKLYDKEAVLEEYCITAENFIMAKIFEGDKSDNINGVKGIATKTLVKNIPTLSKENNSYSLQEIYKYAHKHKDDDGNFFVKILQNKELLERNYKLMQLEDVNISASTKTKLIDVIRGPIRRLVKFKFESMFMEDRLFQNLPNVNSWLAQTFTTMDKYAEQTNG